MHTQCVQGTRLLVVMLWVCVCVSGQAFTTASIYTVHDEVKDKEFELELSWVGEGVYVCAPAVSHCLPSLSPLLKRREASTRLCQRQ